MTLPNGFIASTASSEQCNVWRNSASHLSWTEHLLVSQSFSQWVWSKLVKKHSKAHIPDAALPWEMLCQCIHASCLCRLQVPSKHRFPLHLLAGAILADVSLLHLHPSAWFPSRTTFAAFHVIAGFVCCHPGGQGSDWTCKPQTSLTCLGTKKTGALSQSNPAPCCHQTRGHRVRPFSLLRSWHTGSSPLFSFNPLEMEYKAKHRLSTACTILL